MLDWLIIGGGVHGTLLSQSLLRAAGAQRDRIRVLDPHPAPLHRWRELAANTGMRFLRSPAAHHLDDDAGSLDAFARARFSAVGDVFRGAYRRPSRALFEAHAEEVIRRGALHRLRTRGRARSLRPLPGGGLGVETDRGELRAGRVLLAIGAGEQPSWPPWAADLRRRGAPVHHVFEPGFQRRGLEPGRRAVVVGGGLSAVETALDLARDPACDVCLVSRHELRVHPFDTDPDWLGPGRRARFRRARDPAGRRRMITAARHHGSVPAADAAELAAASRRGELRLERASIRGVRWSDELELDLAGSGGERRLVADVVFLATGFSARCPSVPRLDGMVETFGPRRGPCGYPLVDATLRWFPGLYVCGPLAELELGPTARNIHGARLAARRLARIAPA